VRDRQPKLVAAPDESAARTFDQALPAK